MDQLEVAAEKMCSLSCLGSFFGLSLRAWKLSAYAPRIQVTASPTDLQLLSPALPDLTKIGEPEYGWNPRALGARR